MKQVITDGHVNLIKACADSPEMTQWVGTLGSMSSTQRNTAVARMLVKMRVDGADPLMVSALSDLRGLGFLEQFQATLKEFKNETSAPLRSEILKHPLAWWACCELLYFAAVRVLVFTYTGSLISLELYWTAIRVMSLIGLLMLFRPIIWREGDQRHFPVILVPVSIALLVMTFLEPHTIYQSPANYVLAATSLVVGFREEISYRGVLQRLLTDRFGFLAALVTSNIIFVLYHFGVQPFTAWNVFCLFTYGATLGLIFKVTGSIALVALLHTAVDVIAAIYPGVPSQFAHWTEIVLFGLIILILSRVYLKKVRQ